MANRFPHKKHKKNLNVAIKNLKRADKLSVFYKVLKLYFYRIIIFVFYY